MVLLPEPETPITTSAQGPVASATKILRQRRVIDQKDYLAAGPRAVGRQVLACEQPRQDRALVWSRDLKQHFTAGGQRWQRQRDARHEGLDIRLGDADHPAGCFIKRGI